MAVGGQSTSQDDNFLWLLESTGSGYSPPQLLYYDQLQHQFSLLLRTALCYTKLLVVHIRKDNHALTSYLKQVILFIYFFINPNNIDTPSIHYLSPACCCTASSRYSLASSRTPTRTGSTGRRQSPKPGSSRLLCPSKAPGRRTPARQASAVSVGSFALTPPSRVQQTPWRDWRGEEGSKQGEGVCGCPMNVLMYPSLTLFGGRMRKSVGQVPAVLLLQPDAAPVGTAAAECRF